MEYYSQKFGALYGHRLRLTVKPSCHVKNLDGQNHWLLSEKFKVAKNRGLRSSGRNYTQKRNHPILCTYEFIYLLTYFPPYLLTDLLTYLLTDLLTYLLTPWNRVLLGKLTSSQLVKKFPTIYGGRKFITAFTSAPHLSLSWASSIQSIPPHATSWRPTIILSSHHPCLGLPSGLHPSGFPTKTLYTPLLSPIRATCPAHLMLWIYISFNFLIVRTRAPE